MMNTLVRTGIKRKLTQNQPYSDVILRRGGLCSFYKKGELFFFIGVYRREKKIILRGC